LRPVGRYPHRASARYSGAASTAFRLLLVGVQP
jgi:hypothetical protein